MVNKNITTEEREGFYKVLYGRRDVRRQFIDDPVTDECLMRILNAAHHAPSVGFSQPWNFIVIRDQQVQQNIYHAFKEANQEAVELFKGQRKQQYSSLKLQGILDAPINICITCDNTRGGEVVLGKTHQPAMDIYSTVCAVQNLWLAARAENIGVGWVSIIEQARIKEILKIPEAIGVIAYLCLGHVSHFLDEPELSKAGWGHRMGIESLIFRNRWGE